MPGHCLSCQSKNLIPVFSLGLMPVVNSFPPEIVLKTKFPLDVLVCGDCWVCQLGEAPDPNLLFKNYKHVSGASPDNVRHLSNVSSVVNKFVGPRDKVLEVGCNDGTLLKLLAEKGIAAQGVDPSVSFRSLPIHNELNTIFELFGSQLAETIARKHGKFKVVIGLNVFAHFTAVQDAFTGVNRLLTDDGVFIFEVAYAMNTIFEGRFDTVYHEHVFNHTLTGLANMLSKASLRPVDVEILNTQGGSIRVYAAHIDSSATASKAVTRLLESERAKGASNESVYRGIGAVVDSTIRQIRNAISEFLDDEDDPCFLIGAPARGVVIANACGLDKYRQMIPIDDTPEKQNCFFPGLNARVMSWSAISAHPRSKAIMLSWNYHDTMKRRLFEAGFKGKLLSVLPCQSVETI